MGAAFTIEASDEDFLEKVSANRFRCLKDTNRFITHMHSTSEEMKNTESDISSGI